MSILTLLGQAMEVGAITRLNEVSENMIFLSGQGLAGVANKIISAQNLCKFTRQPKRRASIGMLPDVWEKPLQVTPALSN